MKAEICRGRQKEGGLPETEKNWFMNLMRDEMMLTAHGQLLEELRAAGNSGTSRLIYLVCGLKKKKKSAGWLGPFELIQSQTHL